MGLVSADNGLAEIERIATITANNVDQAKLYILYDCSDSSSMLSETFQCSKARASSDMKVVSGEEALFH